MIATRKLVIEAIEARLAADPTLSGYAVKELGSSIRMREYDKHESRGFYTAQPIVSFYHEQSIDDLNRRRRKYAWPVRAYDLPVWGRAKDLRKKFK